MSREWRAQYDVDAARGRLAGDARRAPIFAVPAESLAQRYARSFHNTADAAGDVRRFDAILRAVRSCDVSDDDLPAFIRSGKDR